MKTSRRGALVLVMLVLAGIAHAQVVLPTGGNGRDLRQTVFGLGLFGGPAGGLGLSFRHHLPSAFSYQVTGGIIKVDDKLSYDFGFEGQYDLVRGGNGRFFAGAAASYFYSGRSGTNQMKGPGRVGLGVGGEIAAGLGFHATGELMFTYFTDGTVLPLPQLGLYYYFF
jgi:hypothetical protein